jgi:DNA-binding PadR family transcriptional regulator
MNDLIILATLLSGPMHGYQLKRDAGAILGQEALHNNIIYPLLRRFTEQRWVTKKTVPGERGQKRDRYTLTTLGRKTLIERLSAYTESDAKSLDGFLTRVGLFGALGPETRERVLDGRAAYLNRLLEHLESIEQKFSLQSFPLETVHFLQHQIEAELAWIRHLRKISKQSAERSNSCNQD